MAKRDYRSYNILGDEMQKEIELQDLVQEDSKNQEVELDKEEQNKSHINQQAFPHLESAKQANTTQEINILKKETTDSKSFLEMSITQEGINIDNNQTKEEANLVQENAEVAEELEKSKSTARKSRLSKINETLDKISTSKIKSEKVDLANLSTENIKSFEKEITDSMSKEQTYHENHNTYNINNDTSFSTYKDNYQKKERSRFVKWGMRLAKLILILMLLPFIGIIGSVILTFLGFFIAGIVGSFGVGIFIIGITSFFATQISALLIALGITSSITALAFGSILTILFIMMIKQIRNLIQRYRKPRRIRTSQEGR
ncbi:lipopolysaccharide biosynthesis protein [Cellulosilyticum lentocellum]|uniref:Uncharacterized protein n=1 Tax=Cellulosilyticum lentocellum (strain ATCC 49066 / DSM 5427 / NCIMB 11756 / RHM5) TaxID=642492 RepID=F2JSL1_CELLD|nr:MFS transporter [Cellulosilyticum lentocellum]ADZ81791.1 hypothetical protein Clole_0029 [Cellulosilyticum lentocellum DSM 5427]